MGWFPLSGAKEAFFFALPSIWPLVFSSSADYAIRDNLDRYFRAAWDLAGKRHGEVTAHRPDFAYADVSFNVGFSIPGGVEGLPLTFTATPESANRPSLSLPITGSGPEDFRLEGLTLKEGRYRLALVSGGRGAWKDSIEVRPKSALELRAMGFDEPALSELASRSRGETLVLPTGPVDEAVTSKLPKLREAQIRSERTITLRLYNSRPLFFLAAALLSLSWILRKRWNFD